MKPRLRAERPDDVAAISAVHEQAFPTSAEARLVEALRRADSLTLSLLCAVGADVIGHIAFSPVTLRGAGPGLGLAPVAVLPARQRTGIGAALVRAGLERARRRRFGYVVVLGDPGYYGRFGFLPAAQRGLLDEFGGGDAFQLLELASGAIPPGGGRVRYAEPFGLFS